MTKEEYLDAFILGINVASHFIANGLAGKDLTWLPNGNVLTIIEEDITNNLIDKLKDSIKNVKEEVV